MESPTLLAARKYLAAGWSVFPLCPRGKTPLIEWKEFQSRRATNEELERWFGDGKNNVGIVAGEISGLAVIDCDSPEAIEIARKLGMPPCPTVRTARGMHFYFAYEIGLRNFQKTTDLPGIDLRAEGGYVVAPPSIHPSGITYEWEEA